MPKLIMMGTNDEYWPADAVKNYIYEIPGENYLRYEPNAGHDMGGGQGAMMALSAFFNKVIYNEPQSLCEWEVTSDTIHTGLTIKASPDIVKATLWSCDSPDQDFRNDKFRNHDFSVNDPSNIIIEIHHPESGYKAFYVELTYPDPVGGTYSKTTRMFVADDDELFLK
jgi:PhoPQ-activated pathogenicity-related protein